MPDQKISELAAITTIDNAADVLPIVDTSATTTKKVTPTQLKTSLALNNVDNTSDANKPISSATQTALDAKASTTDLTAHTTNVSNPHSVTKTQVGLSNVDNTTDLNKPISTATQTALNAKQDSLGFTAENVANKSTSVTTDQASNTKYPSVKSVYDWVSAAFQATLVSGTNIKTINSTSLLGSGDITISASPSGVSGAIQFSNGSAFASDASNLFWDDTNNRLGIGTNAPSLPLEVNGAIYANGSKTNTIYGQGFITTPGTFWQIRQSTANDISFDAFNGGSAISSLFLKQSGGNVGINTVTPTAKLEVKGSGSTSATTSLLVQNSAGTEAFRINDGLVATFANNVNASNFIGNIRSDSYLTADGGFFALRTSSTGNSRLPQSVAIGTSSEPAASAALDIVSTTKGVLFPRMTTTQKNAITAVAGLVLYDSTTNKLQCYNGSTWNDLF